MKIRWHCVAQAWGIPLVYILFRNIFLCKSSISALIKIILTYSILILYCNNWRNHSSSICYFKKNHLSIDAMTTFENCVLGASNMISLIWMTSLNSLNSCKSSVWAFVTCPKQGLEMESVVLHRVGYLAYFCPNQGQDFKPSAAPLYPNMGQVSPPPPPGGGLGDISYSKIHGKMK